MKDMNPEHARGFTPEKKKDTDQLAGAKQEKKTLRPDGQEDLMREVYERNRSKVTDELTDLKDEEDGARFELAELAKTMLDTPESDPQKVEDIAERVAEVNHILEDIASKRRDLEGKLKDVNDMFQPFKDLTDEEMEESLHDITFGGITDEEAEKALEPLEEIHEVTDDMIIGTADDEEKLLAKKDWAEELDRVTPPPLPLKRKKTGIPPPPPPDALVKTETGTDERLPEERVLGARAAFQAEYELTGDGLEVIKDTNVPRVPETTSEILDNELVALFEEAERLRKEARSEISPADSARERERRELGDETTVRDEVSMLEKKLSHMHEMGFSQKNLERLLEQKGVHPDKFAVSGMYRARVKVKSLFDPKLRMLLVIYGKKTDEIADIQKRIQTGKLRLEDPERYIRLMQDQKARLDK